MIPFPPSWGQQVVDEVETEVSHALVLVTLLQFQGQLHPSEPHHGVTAPRMPLTIRDQAKGPSLVFAEYLKDVLLHLLGIMFFFHTCLCHASPVSHGILFERSLWRLPWL